MKDAMRWIGWFCVVTPSLVFATSAELARAVNAYNEEIKREPGWGPRHDRLVKARAIILATQQIRTYCEIRQNERDRGAYGEPGHVAFMRAQFIFPDPADLDADTLEDATELKN